MKQKAINIKEGTTGLISYYAKKHGKFINRTFLWDNNVLQHLSTLSIMTPSKRITGAQIDQLRCQLT